MTSHSQLLHQAPSFGKQIAQVRPSGTSAVLLYACPSTAVVEISLITICNPAASDQLANIYHDDDGTTYDTTTALIEGVVILDGADITGNLAPKGFLHPSWPRGSGIWMHKAGNIGVKTNLANSMTFTAYGVIYEIN